MTKSKRQAGSLTYIEITEAMVWAGVAELGRWPEDDSPDHIVRMVLEAALKLAQSPSVPGLVNTRVHDRSPSLRRACE